VGPELRPKADDIANALRTARLSTATSFEDRPLKAQLRMADRLGARFAVILGEKEAAQGRVTVRRLDDGVQRILAVDRAIAWIKGGDEVIGIEGTGR
jgi:histidyl-tRNA synthetase